MLEKNKFVEALVKYPENKLSTEGIIPLLKKMGYEKVEFYGGQNEEGKDIVFWEKDKWDKPVLRVAQVKHFKFSNRAADSKSFQGVVNQLIACFLKPLPYTDKVFRKPIEVFLITSHIIDTKTLLTRLHQDLSLRDQNIRIIDGLELAEKFLEIMPEFVKEVAGISFQFNYKMSTKFSNEILMKALGKSGHKNLKLYYTDVDFSLGKISTELFFKSSFSPKRSEVWATIKEWQEFKLLYSHIVKVIESDFLETSITAIEKNSIGAITKYDDIKKAINQLECEYKIAKENLDHLFKQRAAQTKILAEIQGGEAQIIISDATLPKLKTEKARLNRRKANLIKIQSKYSAEEKKMVAIKDEISKSEKQILIIEKQKTILENQLDELKLKFTIDGNKLASQLTKKKMWVEDTVSKFNKARPTKEELTLFIKRCDEIIKASSIIFEPKFSNIFRCLGYCKDKYFRVDFAATRLRLSIKDIFDTGLNIAVLGEAGAGKSTSLEMYTLSKKEVSETSLLVPLGQIVQGKLEQEASDQKENSLHLEFMIISYLNTIGIQISEYEFKSILNSGQLTLLLDGLDEAIKVYPLLPEAIHDMSIKYANVQFIVSSRMHGNYINRIPFFAVTLLPFTDGQRDDFIYNWLKTESDFKLKVQKTKDHLIQNSSISEIARNPLLCTTLCVLAQYNISLPKTELRLYDERLKLFTGYYDNVKFISSRIESVPTNLEIIAQKLAFYLHSENKREEEIDILKNKAHLALSNRFDAGEIDLAFKELMYPCEILIPMSPSGGYGFGHLRFQEHLAARELMNRNLSVIQLLTQDWWKATILLFIQMNDRIQWLIEEIAMHDYVDLPVVKEMIALRHKVEREKLNHYIKKYLLEKEKFY